MTLMEALKKGKRVRIDFRDEYREINCPIIFFQPNKICEFMNSIVGEVYPVKSEECDYAKVLWVSDTSFDELVFRLFPQRKGVA